jgi:hypothetical protein
MTRLQDLVAAAAQLDRLPPDALMRIGHDGAGADPAAILCEVVHGTDHCAAIAASWEEAARRAADVISGSPAQQPASDAQALLTDQYARATSDFDAVAGAAAAGDQNSAAQLQGYADTVLTTSRAINGFSVGYEVEFRQVLNAALSAGAEEEARLRAALVKEESAHTATMRVEAHLREALEEWVALYDGWSAQELDRRADPATIQRLGQSRAALSDTPAPASAKVVLPQGCTGRSLSFEPGVLSLDADGSGTLTFGDEVMSKDEGDDECGPTLTAKLAATEILAIRDWLNEYLPPPASASGTGTFQPTHRHKKRGSVYQVIGTAQLQATEPLSDNAQLTVYRAEDRTLWVRSTGEFNDGRFEPLVSHEPALASGEHA